LRILFNAKGAVFISAWGIAPGILVRISSALKARFICAPDCFSRSVSQFVAQVAREFANAAGLKPGGLDSRFQRSFF